MKIKSALLTEASGSIGGLTASHNRGGLYLRARTIPTNPGSPEQNFVRALMNDLVNAWNNTLTAAQREGWKTFAENTLRSDTLGEARKLTALNWYVAMNVPRQQAGLARVNVAPETFSMATFTPMTAITVDASADTASVPFTSTNAWANEIGGALLVSFSRPQNASVEYFKGPYRFAGAILGAATPPTSPAVIALPFPVEEDQQVFWSVRAVRADGRISEPFRGSSVAGP